MSKEFFGGMLGLDAANRQVRDQPVATALALGTTPAMEDAPGPGEVVGKFSGETPPVFGSPGSCVSARVQEVVCEPMSQGFFGGLLGLDAANRRVRGQPVASALALGTTPARGDAPGPG